ncbi:hypothetical protein SAY86_006624 [Trapa natans]|uniref:RING-type domain-containing protein n=1 Tax=Trapa natans TaxID=22666 RepID=A0AAN7L4U7_TRANT|nr:hypothetical protein SAY86_006624 [Trapa natans]
MSAPMPSPYSFASMNTRHFFSPEFLCNSGVPSNSPASDIRMATGTRPRAPRSPSSPNSLLVRAAARISRGRGFSFLRRVFHYQNGLMSDIGSNPFNSTSWMALELVALLVQIGVTTFTLAISKRERPVWPMRVWIVLYEVGSFLSILLLYGRYRLIQRDDYRPPDVEQQRAGDEHSRTLHLMNKCRTSLELFFAIWFVMGNVWVFDSRFGSFRRAPKLHVLCISLLAWNALTYSFPFLLFLLLCCIVPTVSIILGYNMNTGSVDRGASDEQISKLHCWRFKEADNGRLETGNCTDEHSSNSPECCICLANYREKEEVRQLPCSHMFHQKCVDQWLRIISCCPLCKQELER